MQDTLFVLCKKGLSKKDLFYILKDSFSDFRGKNFTIKFDLKNKLDSVTLHFSQFYQY